MSPRLNSLAFTILVLAVSFAVGGWLYSTFDPVAAGFNASAVYQHTPQSTHAEGAYGNMNDVWNWIPWVILVGILTTLFVRSRRYQ